jgi:adenylate kinase family enzyme
MQRVAVVGSGGAGKTTFATALAGRTGLPVVHLDEHYFRPGWIPTPRPEWRRWQEERFAGSRWIAEGSYDHTLDVRLSRADTVIILAPPGWRCVWSGLWRSVRNRGRAVQAAGCPERLLFLRPDFYRWILQLARERQALDTAVATYSGRLTVVELRSRAEMARFLDRLTAGGPATPGPGSRTGAHRSTRP